MEKSVLDMQTKIKVMLKEDNQLQVIKDMLRLTRKVKGTLKFKTISEDKEDEYK